MSDHDYNMDPIDRVVHLTVKEYRNPINGKKGGSALAAVIGMPESTLLNKANPNEQYAHLSLKEARQVMLASGDHRILHQLASDVGEACVPLPTLDVVGDLNVLNALTEWQSEIGETAQKVRDTYKDGRVEMREVRDIRQELIEDFQKGMELLELIQGQAEPEERSSNIAVVK